MNYAAQLIDAVKEACGFKSYAAMADAMGVGRASLSEWRVGRGSPMPEERVLQLCEMAKIADAAPWLAGVHADGVKDAQAKREWESLLDRLRPSVAKVAMLGAVLLASSFLPYRVDAASQPTLTEAGYRHYAKLWARLRKTFAALTRGFGHGSPPLLA